MEFVNMIDIKMLIVAAFAALLAFPALGQQIAENQTAGTQITPSLINITNISYLGDEWVTIANQGSVPVNLNGWMLTAGANRYTFPSQTITPGGLLRIHFGHGFDVGSDIYLGLPAEFLSDAGDVITLSDNSGAVVSRYAYPGLSPAEQAVQVDGAPFPAPPGQPLGQVQRGVLVEPIELSPASRGAQILPNATSTDVTQLANVSAIFETNQAVNMNITNVGITGDEFIQVTNEGIVPVNLTGWALTAGTDFSYVFPLAIIPVGGSLRVHPGAGASTQTDLYLNMGQDLLDDSADVVSLYNSEGTVIARYTYPAGAGGLVSSPGMVRSPATQPILFGNATRATPDTTTGASPSGEAFLQTPVPPLPGTTVGQVQQVVSGSG